MGIIKIYRLLEEDDPEAVLVSDKTKQPLSVRQVFSNVKDIGRLAAEKFKEGPQKRQKLKNLSPHWLRHLWRVKGATSSDRNLKNHKTFQ